MSHANNIQKYAIIRAKAIHHFFYLRTQIIQIRRIETQPFEPRPQRIYVDKSHMQRIRVATILRFRHPFWMGAQGCFIQTGGEINWCFNIDFTTRLQLPRQQFLFHAGMAHANCRVVITHPVMTFGKQRNRIDMSTLEHLLELRFVKLACNVWNLFTGMKI